MYMYTDHNHIPAKKLYRFKMAAKITDFYFASFRFWPKFEGKKNTFPKEFFNVFWLIVGQHEYIYIAKIKIGNFYSQVILGAKQFFFRTAKNAN